MAFVEKVFSGVQPTGNLHLGNYLGAIVNFVKMQETHDCIYCVVDMHAITQGVDVWGGPAELARNTREVTAAFIAAGIDPKKHIVFNQSQVSGHAELAWIFNCVARVGWLSRMTQFKEKAGKDRENASVGLYDYPVLMAADILLYDTQEVPVGDDQRQHVELTRDIALRFNARFGATLTVPTATFPASGARILDLQQPTKKMSKSDGDSPGCVFVLDDPKRIVKKIKSAVTDSETEIRYDTAAKPGISNLLDIYAACTGHSVAQAEAAFSGQRYGDLKVAVADATVAMLEPVQQRYRELSNDPGEIDRMLAVSAERATERATPVLERMRDAMGLLAPARRNA